MNEVNQELLNGIDKMIQDALKHANFDRTYKGVIENIPSAGIYTVNVNRKRHNLKSNLSLKIGDVVWIKYPLNNEDLMFIENIV
ncbi:protein of unknown function [Ruminococcaceae bacterium BL-6]|nr:protein of unknown function [Ruminococcaceae bacterium BL-6]